MPESLYLQGEVGVLHALRYHSADSTLPPAICLHGVTGHAGMWDSVARHLATNRTVIALDFRGHGESDWSPLHAYRTEDHLQDLNAAIKQLGYTQFDLIGLSWGALVAMRYATTATETLRRLAIVDVEPNFEQGEQDVFPRPRQFATRQEVLNWERTANPQAPEALLRQFAFQSVCQDGQGGWHRKHDTFFFTNWPFRNDDLWPALADIHCPTLLINGGRSFVRLEVMQRMAQMLPNASGPYCIEDSSHLIPLETPSLLGEYLGRFLNGQPY